MPVPLEQFVKHLEDSGILAGDTLKKFLPPTSEPKDAEELARNLVRKKKLTKFQAEQVYQGKGKALILDDYLLLEKIGQGGMGQVFKARHRRMDRIVAVKILPAHLMKDAATVARFEREVRAAARITHPNIVTAFDAGQAGSVHFLVMECVDGSDLAALVKKNGPFPVEQAVNYILQAARGLEGAHAEGIVHRDIKPANLLLDKKGTVKILDMGLARIGGDTPGQAELTNTGAIMGTVDYMAPEQALNTKSADARADIYSLGCSLYYLLTGKATYDGDTLMAKLLAHRDQPIPSIRASRPEVPEAVEAVFSRMVAKRIEDRYQTMSEVTADLESLAKGQAPSINTQPSSGSFADTGLTNFLNDIALTEAKPVQRQKKTSAGPAFWKENKKNLLIGGGILGGLILLAGIVISLRTKDGTLVVKVNEPDAEVQVLSEEGKIEITRKGEKGPITISVVPGKHQLKVKKDGFELFTDNFEIKSGGNKSITAKLVAVEEKPALAATSWHGWPADAPKPAVSPFDVEQAMRHQEAWAKYLGVPVTREIDLPGSEKLELVLVPPGEFLMGSSIEEQARFLTEAPTVKDHAAVRNEVPQHRVAITQPFYLGKYELTQAQWQAVMGHNPAEYRDLPNHPVERVSWDDVQPLLAKLNERSTNDIVFALPTEAQWEFACRAGTTTFWYCGDSETELLKSGWFIANSGNKTHPVGQLRPNRFGLYDMHGNVWELCADRYAADYYANSSATDPIGPAIGFERVDRGGGFDFLSWTSRSANRDHRLPSDPHHNLGLRLVAAIVVPKSEDRKPSPLASGGWQGWPADSPKPAIAPFDAAQAKKHQEVWAAYLKVPVEYANSIGMKFVLIPPGEFLMGADADENKWVLSHPEVPNWKREMIAREGVRHRVIISKPFRIGIHEVTVAQFRKFVEATGFKTESELSGTARATGLKQDHYELGAEYTWNNLGDLPLTGEYPVMNVSWNDANAFCAWLSKHENAVYRLCTEAEWEYACRAGTTTRWSFGDNAADTELYAWWNHNYHDGRPEPVGRKRPNPFGLFDMHGNVFEWCSDVFLPYSADEAYNPAILEGSGHRVYRGGGPPAIRPYGCVLPTASADIPSATSLIGFRVSLPVDAVKHGGLNKVATLNSPDFQQWMKDVQAMPAEKQLEAVSKKLVKLNTGFDGKLTNLGVETPVITNGIVTNLGLVLDNITDISPVKALAGIKVLRMDASWPKKSKFSDLSPLEGLRLTEVSFNHTNVADLEPLRGMPLETVAFFHTRVASLSPLLGMPLKMVRFGGAEITVSDLSPLREAPLAYLDCSSPMVSDLSPLAGKKLSSLDIRYTRVSDFRLLSDMPLKNFYFDIDSRIDAHHELVRILRSMKTLEQINFTPVAEFWKKYDAGEFGKPTPQ